MVSIKSPITMHNATVGITQIWNLLSAIPDPEVPVITISDLGILRSVDFIDGNFVITITPTYSGCPAMKAIEEEIAAVLNAKGISNFKIKMVYSPAWTTDWMNDSARQKLKDYGIAPPSHTSKLNSDKKVNCPFCNSENTKLTSWFGSTACKALHYCNNCCQPFEEFKCH